MRMCYNGGDTGKAHQIIGVVTMEDNEFRRPDNFLRDFREMLKELGVEDEEADETMEMVDRGSLLLENAMARYNSDQVDNILEIEGVDDALFMLVQGERMVNPDSLPWTPDMVQSYRTIMQAAYVLGYYMAENISHLQNLWNNTKEEPEQN